MNSQLPARNLLLAVDGSEHANAAAHFVKDLPLTKDCHVDIISVLIPRNAQYHVFLEEVLAQTKASLEVNHPQKIQTHLLTGYPAEQIVAYAEEHKPDLIAMGACGLRSTLGILLGGVAQQVVEYACCPVLIVRAPYQGIRNVLLTTDGSEQSHRALNYIQDYPLPGDAFQHVITVIPPEITPEMVWQTWSMGLEISPPLLTETMQEQLQNQNQAEEEHAQKLIQKAARILGAPEKPVISVIRRGDAATEIMAYAQEMEIDLIVMGSRGLSEFRGWLLGSVSRKLVHYAKCSVLIVKSSDSAPPQQARS
jgi:nucleotide-binding universal stress UspA family protein